MTMAVTHNDLIQLRKKLLKEMNTYIIEMGDEEIWATWIMLGVPDEPDDDIYEFIATHEDLWLNCCEVFHKIYLTLTKSE